MTETVATVKTRKKKKETESPKRNYKGRYCTRLSLIEKYCAYAGVSSNPDYKLYCCKADSYVNGATRVLFFVVKDKGCGDIGVQCTIMCDLAFNIDTLYKFLNLYEITLVPDIRQVLYDNAQEKGILQFNESLAWDSIMYSHIKAENLDSKDTVWLKLLDGEELLIFPHTRYEVLGKLSRKLRDYDPGWDYYLDT